MKKREVKNPYDTIQIGAICKSNSHGDFKILSEQKRGRSIVYTVQFIVTGTICEAQRYAVHMGSVRDPYAKIILGRACLGRARVMTDYEKYMYNTWQNMLRRCYDETRHNYSSYGLRGCTVCDRWLCFEHFLEDIVTLPNYNEQKILAGELVLDKDELNSGAKQYSPEFCQWVTKEHNAELRDTSTYTKRYNIYTKNDVLLYSQVTLKEAAELTGYQLKTLHAHIYRGADLVTKNIKLQRCEN